MFKTPQVAVADPSTDAADDDEDDHPYTSTDDGDDEGDTSRHLPD